MAKTAEERRAYQREYRRRLRKEQPEKVREAKRRSYQKYKPKRNAKNKAWRLAHPERYRVFRRKARGLPTPIRPEPNSCECCGRPAPNGLCLDHCHNTQEFRGWLCRSCNIGIGHLGDTLEGVNRAARYLKMASVL